MSSSDALLRDPTDPPPRRTTAAIGFMVASASLFGLMSFLGRLATTSAPWTFAASGRSLIGAVIALAFARARRQSVVPNGWSALFWRSLFGTISMMGTFYALSSRTLSLGNTVTLLNLGPLFLAILAPIVLHERTRPAVGIGVVLGLAGVVLIVRPAFLFGTGTHDVLAHAATVAGPSAAVTILAATGGALATSLAMMMLRRVGQKESPETIAFHFSMFAGVVTGGMWLLAPRLPSPRDAVLVVLAGACAGVAQLFMTRAYTLEEAARIGGLSYLTPLVSTVLGAVVLDDRPHSLALVGMGLVVVGGVVVTFVRPRQRPASRARLGGP